MSKDAIDNNLRQVIRDLTRRISALERQQQDVGQLSELSSDMGLVTAGEFRAGNGIEPGEGFSGVRMTADGVSGYDNDVLQSQMSATDGKITAGAGDVTIDNDGITIKTGTATANILKWLSDEFACAEIYVTKTGSSPNRYGTLYIDVNDEGTGQAFFVINVGGAMFNLAVIDSVKTWNFDNAKFYINFDQGDYDTKIYGTAGMNPVLAVDAGDNDVDIATKLNFGDTGAITGGSETINDDAAFSFTPATARGVLIFRSGGAQSTIYGMFTYAAVSGTAYCYAWTGAGSATVAATGALSGTTGTDTKVTVSAHTDGKIYIENRSGGNLNCAWQIVAGT